jgi:transmembrane 9 superfamily protein 2/4
LVRDVFRPPKKALLLSVFLGTGVQVGSMLFLTLGFATIGLLDHSQRGSLLTTIILLYNFMGAFAGYYSSRFYKMFNVNCFVDGE